jgi:translation initiation factor 1 (eIF-1/SUI1)
MNISFEDFQAQFKGVQGIENYRINETDIIVNKVKNRYYVTVIKNVGDKVLCSMLKKKLGCGGSIIKEGIVLQGDQKLRVKEYLLELNLLVS